MVGIKNAAMLDMTAIQTHRKARLRDLIDDRFGGVVARFAEHVDRTESYIGRMLYLVDKAQQRPVGDKMALLFEARCELVRGWFDLPTGAQLAAQLDAPAAANPPDRSVQETKDISNGPLLTIDDRSHRERTPIVWPFYQSSYSRIAALQAIMGSEWPEARDSIDAYLDTLIERWEREALRRSVAKNKQAS